MDEFVCGENKPHAALVSDVLSAMPRDDELCALSEFFRVFGDPTRLRMLYALSRSELCVCDLAALLGSSQSAVSHQLQILRSKRLVRYRREGKTVFYSLDDEHIFSMINMAIEHGREQSHE